MGVCKDIWGLFKEHLRAPCPICDHSNTTGNHIRVENLSIITQTIKKAIYIRVNKLFLNRNIGKFQLSPIWDEGTHCTWYTTPYSGQEVEGAHHVSTPHNIG